MNSKAAKITGWVLSVVLTLFLIGASARAKLMGGETLEGMAEHIGYTTETLRTVGIVEAIIAISILIPRINFVGALLLTAYLGGATATHVRLEEAFIAPVVVGVVLWTAMALRRPDVFAAILGISPPAKDATEG